MHAITFDTFKFVRRLKDAGIPENQAEAISEAVKETHLTQFEDVAARRDLKDLENQLATKVGVADVTKMDTHILELKRDIKELDVKIETTKAELRRDIKELEYRMTIRLGLMLMAAFGMLFAALRYFPPTQPIIISGHPVPAYAQGTGQAPGVGQPAIPQSTP